jgi:asparagine synthase (glutamine-hydrolysing)
VIQAVFDRRRSAVELVHETGWTHEGDMVCALEGRLTNLAELAAKLKTGATTSAVLAAGFERWGEELPRHCEGQFALFVWDGRRGVVARDPLGHRSVYVCERGDRLAVATEVRPLLDLLPTRPAPDEIAVAYWLTRRGIPDDRTLYAGVRRLLPGRQLTLGADGWTRRRYWEPRRDVGIITDRREAVAHLREAMEAAVGRSTAGVREPAVLLSGGFDSGSICALLRPRAAYSCVFPTIPEADETGRIAAMRDAFGLRGAVRRFEGGSAVAAALEFLARHGLPPASPNGFIWRPLVRQAGNDGVLALLDGEGGDELFGCAPFLIADLLPLNPARALRLARQLPGMGAAPPARWVRRALAEYGARGLLPLGWHERLRSSRRRRGRSVTWLRPALEGRIADRRWDWKLTAGPRWRAALVHAVVERSEALGAQEHQRRESELCAVHFAHPYRDPQLLDAVLAVDPALMFDAHLDRPLARAAVEGLLPDEVRLSTSKPFFNAALGHALRHDDAQSVTQLLAPGNAVGDYIRLDVVGSSVRSARAAPGTDLALWRVLMLECWLRMQSDALPVLPR